MNLLRTVARPTLAAPFVVDGLDALARPGRHAEKFEKVQPVLERAGMPPVLHSDAELLTRISGAVSVFAGLGLATGRAPRTCAAVLAALNIPLTLVNHPVWAAEDADARRRALSGLMRSAAVGAGLALSAVDREGRPSLAWRRENRRQVKAAMAAVEAQVRARYEPAQPV
ncbi:DoxX family membrane protein [Actinomyces sp.]|uniref:DoxX family membrane protein n=1 Tax=Actinomyces sp. TaxID=29317 RepID=UPI0026DCF389|nr:DoxX family membrane protein [Actinomyces sp.]MDO4899482.1 DoxX family membrane protein [Actinomyces sp.]